MRKLKLLSVAPPVSSKAFVKKYDVFVDLLTKSCKSLLYCPLLARLALLPFPASYSKHGITSEAVHLKMFLYEPKSRVVLSTYADQIFQNLILYCFLALLLPFRLSKKDILDSWEALHPV